jgi:molybdopterin-guanine dinucleotide biosynthesis protein A
MFDGYILIGGASSRMRTDKFALRLGESTFAERALTALRGIADNRVYYVVGANLAKGLTGLLPPGAPVITDVIPNKAALGGIYTVLSHSVNDWTAVLACDYPFVTGDLFLHLAKIANSAATNISAIVPVQPDGRIQPLCAVYRAKHCLHAAKQLLESDVIPPARRLPENVSTRYVQFAEITELPGAKYFFTNINTPEEYVEAQNIFRRLGNK